MSKSIALTQGLFTIVDNEDYDWLSKWKWCTIFNDNNWYAVRNDYLTGKHHIVYMHREILGLKYGDGKKIDHQNNNGLDNRRNNLRVCTGNQNQWNQKCRPHSSQYKGVSLRRPQQKWMAQIVYNNKKYYLGIFDDELDAAKTYNSKAKELFGDFARLNFGEEDETN